MESKIFGYLGLAARARKIAIGETAIQLITSKKAKIVFLASDSSDRTHSRVQRICNSCAVPCVDRFTSDEISSAIGQFNRMIVVVTEEGLAKQILNCLK